jgi:hypothetical protein
MKSQSKSRLGWVAGGLVLLTGLLSARVAFSGKASEAGGSAPISTGPSPMPLPGGCDNTPSFELASKLINQVIENKRWTQKDHERITPLFFTLHTDQKIELLKRVGAAIDSQRLVLERGARLF